MNLQKKLDLSRQPLSTPPGTIPVKENGDSLVSLHSSKTLQIIPIWVEMIDPFEGPAYRLYIEKHPNYQHIYTRQTVATMLEQVTKKLPHDWQLVVRASHRPLEVQHLLFDQVHDDFKKKHPEKSLEETLAITRTFVSDPTQKVPPHSSGAAVDVDVFNTNSQELVDFGCPVNTDDTIAFLYAQELTAEQKHNRLVLLSAMLDVGFASLYTEWWHFSYGDQNWASFYNKKNALYGLVEPEV